MYRYVRSSLRKICAGLLLVSFTATASDALACTTFNIPESTEKAFGKTYDWHASHGYMFINKRNLQKTALERVMMRQPATWISKYGSLTYSQHGREMPLGGMNEAGLVVDIMILGSSRYPTNSDLPTLNELQWIQYILDTSANVAEAVDNARRVHVDKNQVGVHYLVCDRDGECATFEYLNRELVVHEGDEMIVNALANDTYADSVAHLNEHEGFGGTRAIPTGGGSLSRFVRAAHLAKQFDVSTDDARVTSYAFSILDSVGGSSTVWKLVYQPVSEKLFFKLRGDANPTAFSTAGIDFSCTTPVKYLDLTGQVSGSRDTAFKTYTRESNHALVQAGNRSIGSPFTATEVARFAAYPESHACLE